MIIEPAGEMERSQMNQTAKQFRKNEKTDNQSYLSYKLNKIGG